MFIYIFSNSWERLYPFWFYIHLMDSFLFYFFYMDSFLGGVYIYTHTHTHTRLFGVFFQSPTNSMVFWFSLSFSYLRHLQCYKYVVYSFFFFLIIRLNRFCIFVAFVWANFLKFDIFYMLMVWESMVKYY